MAFLAASTVLYVTKPNPLHAKVEQDDCFPHNGDHISI